MEAELAGMSITRSILYERLAGVINVVDDKVVQQLVILFAPQLQFADGELLRELYSVVQASPFTSTRAILKASTGLVFQSFLCAGKVAAVSTSRCVSQPFSLSVLSLIQLRGDAHDQTDG